MTKRSPFCQCQPVADKQTRSFQGGASVSNVSRPDHGECQAAFSEAFLTTKIPLLQIPPFDTFRHFQRPSAWFRRSPAHKYGGRPWPEIGRTHGLPSCQRLRPKQKTWRSVPSISVRQRTWDCCRLTTVGNPARSNRSSRSARAVLLEPCWSGRRMPKEMSDSASRRSSLPDCSRG